MSFFLSAEETIYGRYGSRDAKSAQGRLSLAGLRHAMKAALTAHRQRRKEQPAGRRPAPVRAEDYSAARLQMIRGACIHCHQVREFQRAQRKKQGRWQPEQAWVYPLPENVGLTLEIDRGNRVRSVADGSPAHRAGLRVGDWLRHVNGVPTASQADVQYGLHKAPAGGRIPLSWERRGKPQSGALQVKKGWRKTDLSWRPSMRALVPSLGMGGKDLSAREKKALGLSAAGLALRPQSPLTVAAREIGLRKADVVIGIDRHFPDMTVQQFLAHVRRTYVVGERVTLHLVRE